jgi:hypothetical protein
VRKIQTPASDPWSGYAAAQQGLADRGGQRDPVVVLAYPYSGVGFLQGILSGHPMLACTAGTGVLPLCQQAAVTWRRVEDRDGPLSPLAVASIRALAGTMITAISAGAGGLRWCEFASPRRGSAETFLQIYPAAKYICLHRSCLDVIQLAILSNPWGLAESALEPFASTYPGNAVAVAAAYWQASTDLLLDFEQTHVDQQQSDR